MNLIFDKVLRRFKKVNPFFLICFAIVLVASCSQRKNETSVTQGQPNLIFIMVDDMGYGDLGSYGQTNILTPNLDKLAAESMVFTQFYAGSPVCAPARSVLMTGYHTGHTTVRGNFGQGGVIGLCGNPGRVPLKAEDLTIAQVLQQQGYVTGMTGKWGLGEPNTTGEPNDKGFDEWFGFLNQARAHRQYPEYIWHNRERFDIPANADGNKGHYVHHLFTDFALQFIDKHAGGDKPFFLYLPYTLPHSDLEIDEIHPAYANKDWSERQKVYASMITLIDRDVNRIVKLLEEKGVDKNTLLMFTTDNGAANRYDGVFNSSGILRGAKRDVYEGGIRVPLIAYMPGTIKPGVNEEFTGYFADILPTFATLAGAQVPQGLDGIDFSDVLKQGQKKGEGRLLYWEFHEQSGSQAVRKGKWKAVRLDVHERGFHNEVELYDLSKDPSESTNIASEFPEVQREMIQLMDEQHVFSPIYPFKFQKE
ncbi:MAG: arylsulfatase [Cyclobacteriaceae bacterium]|nr:arylsulfatase [Cyclobacteriaceae bacterium]